MPKLSWIEVEGFRSFVKRQRLDLSGPMAVVWAPNSQGKTSLAEAVEFLLTGRTVRRELATSAVREFSDCLRNAHLSEGQLVQVSAEIVDASGLAHATCRVLASDYGANRKCQSKLFLDGIEVEDLSSIGITLSRPPLEAPVLMQHTLRYALMADPQERADYFKALLEISDLETLRSTVVASRNALTGTTPEALHRLETLAARVELREHLVPLQRQPPQQRQLEEALIAAVGAAFPPGTPLPDTLSERTDLLRQQLEEQRRATFPLEGLDARHPPNPQKISPSAWNDFDLLLEARRAVDTETVRLTQLFTAVLATPGVGDIAEPIDCPLCETAQSLTPARIASIRAELENSRDYQAAVTAAANSLRIIKALPDQAVGFARSTLPPFAAWDAAERQRRGFSKAAIELLLSNQERPLLDLWTDESSRLKLAIDSVELQAHELRQVSAGVTLESFSKEVVLDLAAKAKTLADLVEVTEKAATRYRSAEAAVSRALRVAIDHKNQFQDWTSLIDLVEMRADLLVALLESHAQTIVAARVETALNEIDHAKGLVLDEKFGGLSSDIERWWNLLRPGEPVGFAGVDRAGSGRRFIDLKAKLLPHADSTDPPKLRNAVAVFSDSQLNCLGLSAFLARTSRERNGFVVLDDPVTASDEEHKGMFVARVLDALLAESIQVLLLTHDKPLWRDVQSRYQSLPLDIFQLMTHDPTVGAVAEKTSDTMLSLLNTAEIYIRNQDPTVRKIGAERLRDATERFCKELIVKHRLLEGDSGAALSQYDGKNLRDLRPLADRYLSDPAHPGKLHAITQSLNRGKHDDMVPSAGELQGHYGDLKHFRKTYLS